MTKNREKLLKAAEKFGKLRRADRAAADRADAPVVAISQLILSAIDSGWTPEEVAKIKVAMRGVTSSEQVQQIAERLTAEHKERK